tara:strand:+ start:203 stop:589 length:387 start_codon:yes stop_codon:yes gene_type:complete
MCIKETVSVVVLMERKSVVVRMMMATKYAFVVNRKKSAVKKILIQSVAPQRKPAVKKSPDPILPDVECSDYAKSVMKNPVEQMVHVVELGSILVSLEEPVWGISIVSDLSLRASAMQTKSAVVEHVNS